MKKGKKGAGGITKEDQQDLELVIEDLRNELVWKDEDFREMQEELEVLRKQNQTLKRQQKEECVKRQTLEATQVKYTVLKELTENREAIEEQTFFEQKRNKHQNTKGNLMNQIMEQQKSNSKAALAHKYGYLWLSKIRQKKLDQEKENFFLQ